MEGMPSEQMLVTLLAACGGEEIVSPVKINLWNSIMFFSVSLVVCGGEKDGEKWDVHR